MRITAEPVVYAFVAVTLGATLLLALSGADARPLVLALLAVGAVGFANIGERRRGRAMLRRVQSLEHVARDLAAEMEPGSVLRSIPQSALAIVRAEYAAMVYRHGGEFEVAAGAGLAESVVGTRRRTDEGVFGDVMASRATVVVDDYGRHPRALAAVRALGIRGFIAVPMFLSGEMAGCLVVGRLGRRPFDRHDRDAMEGLAAHSAIALGNARRLEQVRRLEALSRSAMEGWEADEVMARVVESAEAAFAADIALIATIGGDEAAVVAATAAASELLGKRGPLGPLLRRTVRSGVLVAIEDYARTRATVRETVGSQFLDRIGGRAAVLAPIRVGEEVAAVLVVGTTDTHRTFDEFDRQGIVSFGEAAAAALRSAAARADRDRRVRRLAALNDGASALAQARDADRIARVAFEVAGLLLARDAFYLARHDEERELQFIFEAGEGLVKPSASAWTGDDEVLVTRGSTDGGSAIHVPLRIGGRTIGIISAQSRSPGAYDDEDVSVLRSLANLVAAAFENIEHLARMRELYLASVKALAAAVDARDPYTRSHSARVSALAKVIAEHMRLAADEVERIQLGALLHDIGKIGIPDAILNKPTALTPDEWVAMRTHPSVGAAILESVEPLADLLPIVRDHHERYDGRGYPAGLQGHAVEMAAHIVAVADAYEVIVSKRSYKEAHSVEFAIAELRRCRGTQFHPEVVDAFLEVVEHDLAAGSGLLARVSAMRQEEIEDMAGPGDPVQRFASASAMHGRRLAVLQRLANEFGAVLDLDELASRLLRIIRDAMGYENGSLLTVDRHTGELVVRAAFGQSEGYAGTRIPRGRGISSWVLEHGRLQNVGLVSADLRFFGPSNMRSNLIVPLRIDDEVVGVLAIESARPNAFSREDEQLLTAVSHQIAAAIQVASLHRVAKHAAATDPLTGLANRRAFFDRLEQRVASGVSAERAITIALIDVDGLKQLNDAYGHQAGDEGLVRVSEILLESVRSEDLVARIGGDEFAILFASAPMFVAETAMQRARERGTGRELSIGVPVPSVTWGLAQATGPATADQLIEAADRAMYRRKRLARASAS